MLFLLLHILELFHAFDVHCNLFFLHLSRSFVFQTNSDFLSWDEIAVLVGFAVWKLFGSAIFLELEFFFAHEAVRVLPRDKGNDVGPNVLFLFEGVRWVTWRAYFSILWNPSFEAVKEWPVLDLTSTWVVLFLFDDLIVLNKVWI